MLFELYVLDLVAMRNILGSFLFNAFFWPICGVYLTVLYPFVFFSKRNAAYKLGYRPTANLLIFSLKIFANVDYKVENLEILQEAMKKGPVIIGCNHQSTWETFIFAKLFEDLSIVIKKELLDIPVAGLYFKRLNCIAIDRSAPMKAIKDLMKFGRESVNRGLSILIFPNGTRSSENGETEFKSGIYAMYKYLKVPVVPTHVNSGKYWPRRSFAKNPGTIHLSFKEPIPPGLSKEEFTERFKTFAMS
ncbi:MAG: 1-acyl-sn-glycerol-3-phosphate acyltransferase [Holosporales bacterium]|jgi:1-acyl-sn-glycerol-3-phosphate acyltransferase|nr:1-acyl-sn-glycerol-3-phosphate acyltransferase [Holosporales bacterium]